MRITLKKLKELRDLLIDEGFGFREVDDLFYKGNYWRTPLGFKVHLNKVKPYLYKVLYETPVEELPLLINNQHEESVIAVWRLRNSI